MPFVQHGLALLLRHLVNSAVLSELATSLYAVDMHDRRYRPQVALRGDMLPTRSSEMSDAHAPSSSSSLSKFVAERPLPSVVRVLAGSYCNVGVNRDNELYVHSASRQTVVVAETLAGKTSMIGRSARRPSQTLTLPLDYDG